ncbi:GntR family transcriptional regulator [Streptomyces noursei]|uniref:GntR family transcriptional regulator n=1 Tax=Streptomyces noursei TaxID=1971 RepID=UPI00382893BF
MSEPSGSQPKYLQVLDQLREDIQRGTYDASERLPTEAALADLYSVSLMTLRKALDMLKVEGVVEGRKGSGNYVRGNDLLQYSTDRHRPPHAGRHTPWATRGPKTLGIDQITAPRETQPPDYIARALALETGSVVLLSTYRLLQYGRPVRLVRTYVPSGLIAGSHPTHADATVDCLHEILKVAGREPVVADEYVRSRPPTTDEAAQLEIPSRRFVLHVCRTGFDEHGVPVKTEEMILDSASHVLSYRFDL